MDAGSIREAIRGVSCSVCEECALREIPGSAKARLNSVTTVVSCTSCGAHFFAKQLSGCAGAAPATTAQEEFDTALRLYAAYPSSDDYGVVKPYRLLPDKRLLFFDYVNGRNASDLLPDLPTDQQIVLLERMGAWLRRFHDATEPSEGPLDLERKLGSLKLRWDDNGPASHVFRHAFAYLNRGIQLIAKSPFQHVGLHGDCKPENFLIRGTQVIGIDVAWKHRNVAEYDLSQFLSQLALLAGSLRGRGLTGSLQPLEGAFLRGYGEARPDSIRLVNWLRVYYYMSYWLSWRKRGYLQRIFWDIYFGVLLRRFLKEIGEGS